MRTPIFFSMLVLTALACRGATGPDGNANVVSGTFSLGPDAYANGFWFFPVDGGNQGTPAKVATVDVPELSEAVVDGGAVLVYVRIPSGPTMEPDEWSLLPFHQGGFGGGYLVSIKAAVEVGRIRIGYVHEATSATVPPNVYQASLPRYEFRWVAIGGPSRTVTPDDIVH